MSDYAIDILNYYDNFDVLINKIKLKRKHKIKKVSNQWRVEKLKTLLKFNPREPLFTRFLYLSNLNKVKNFNL